MAGGKKKTKTTTTTQRRYSKEEVLNAILDLDTDSCDTISSSSSEEYFPTNDIHTNIRQNNCENEIHSSEPTFPKVYTPLENVNYESPVSDISTTSSSVNIEFTSSGENTSSSPASSDSTTTYGHYSSTDSESHNSSPTFPSDNSTESTPTSTFPEYTPQYENHNDSDSGSSLADFDVQDLQLPKSETVTKKRAVLQLNEIPFSVLMQWVRTYLISIEKDASKPEYPVPDMDKNQKRNFRRTTEKFKIVDFGST